MSPQLSDKLLFECNRTCCICTIPGKDVQIHHIDKNSSNNIYDNLIVICLECHSEVHKTGGSGRSWTPRQLLEYKREWIVRVKHRKQESDMLASMHSVTGGTEKLRPELEDIDYKHIDDPMLTRYLEKILIIHKAQKAIAQIDFDSGHSFETVQACIRLVDFYESVLVELSTFYPKGHFEEKHPRIFFSEQIAARNIFQAHTTVPQEDGSIPSMHRQFISYRFMRDVRMMVRDIAYALIDRSGLWLLGKEANWEKEWMEE